MNQVFSCCLEVGTYICYVGNHLSTKGPWRKCASSANLQPPFWPVACPSEWLVGRREMHLHLQKYLIPESSSKSRGFWRDSRPYYIDSLIIPYITLALYMTTQNNIKHPCQAKLHQSSKALEASARSAWRTTQTQRCSGSSGLGWLGMACNSTW